MAAGRGTEGRSASCLGLTQRVTFISGRRTLNHSGFQFSQSVTCLLRPRRTQNGHPKKTTKNDHPRPKKKKNSKFFPAPCAPGPGGTSGASSFKVSLFGRGNMSHSSPGGREGSLSRGMGHIWRQVWLRFMAPINSWMRTSRSWGSEVSGIVCRGKE